MRDRSAAVVLLRRLSGSYFWVDRFQYAQPMLCLICVPVSPATLLPVVLMADMP